MPEIQVINWEKRMTMTKQEIIQFQLLVHCHVQKIHISSADLDCLTLLGQKGSAELTGFCKLVAESNVFKTAQSSRNALGRLQEKGLIIIEGKSRKKLYLNPDIKIQGTGNILVDIKCFSPNKDVVKQ